MTTAREIAEHLRNLAGAMTAIGHPATRDLLREAAQIIDAHPSALLAERRRAIEEAAKVAFDQGCGTEGCRECVGGNIAEHLRSLASPREET